MTYQADHNIACGVFTNDDGLCTCKDTPSAAGSRDDSFAGETTLEEKFLHSARKYRTIVADPPWPQPGGGAASGSGFAVAGGRPSTLPYESLSIQEIAELPVASLANRDAHLYLWVTNHCLEDAFSIVRWWDFRFSTLLTWSKPPRGIGLGGAFTQTTEHVLFARRGTLRATERIDSTWWLWKRGEHSAKPEAFLDMVERVSPAPRLEMFARRNRLGWDTWGNESFEHVEVA